ncbi:hypothetical protein SLH46_18095 [Draconibacterium sp. IB214405]|uniref:hypothetical protein n=1 Tax=Draconibacterium sp. IB214405 TaxID=3097352 RepID=UPI002A14FB18|nr:hypothetical protein [Draconibacterium sp. IB214405]MDX8341116.1 hypothetical protein [Draconibacterium sp. IB214405]
MRTLLLILPLILFCFQSNSQEVDSTKTTQLVTQVTEHNSVSDLTMEEEVPYKVLKKAPTIKYIVTKKGNGNKVVFCVTYGSRNLPKETQISPTNGVPYQLGRKKGYDQLNFPAKFTLFCPSNNFTNPFNSMAQMINNFEIEFYEPGNWEVSFIR